jgi:hypothetical protein
VSRSVAPSSNGTPSSAPSASGTWSSSLPNAPRPARPAPSGSAGLTKAARASLLRSTSDGRAHVLPPVEGGVSPLSPTRPTPAAAALSPPRHHSPPRRQQIRVSSAYSDRRYASDVLHACEHGSKPPELLGSRGHLGGFHRLPSEAQLEEALEGSGSWKATRKERPIVAGIPNRRPSHGRLTRAAVPFGPRLGRRRQ